MTDHKKDSEGMGAAGGILIGVLLTVMVGFGSCLLMLSPIGSSSSNYKSQLAEEQTNQLQQLYKDANQSKPDPKASWLLSLAILHPEAREMLKLEISEAQAQIASDNYYQQALKAGLPAALVKNAYSLINSGITINNADNVTTDSNDAAVQLKDPESVERGVQQIVDVLKSHCTTYYSLDNEDNSDDLEYVLNSYKTTIPLDFNNFSPSVIKPYAKLQNLMDIAELRQQIYCEDRWDVEHQLIKFLMDDDTFTPTHRLVYLSVLAELLDKPDIVYLINRRAPADAQDDFIKERNSLLTAYKTTFGNQIPMDAVSLDNH